MNSKDMNQVDGSATKTIHGMPRDKALEIDPATGMQRDYVVLTEEERAKGFLRPVRKSYRHVGAVGPKNPLRDLTPDESARYAAYKYVKYEEYPETEGQSVVGRYWTQSDLDRFGKGCGSVTLMGRELAETYARDPNFYSGTFCANCRTHFPVGEHGEFIWEGTDQRVGT